MKKTFSVYTLLMCTILLAACQGTKQQKTAESSHKSAASSTQSETSSSSTTAPEKSDEELYADVLENGVKEYGSSYKRYAFYDIDKNGTDELIIGDETAAIALYYLKNNQPERLARSYVSPVGGVRQGFTIYQDGKVSYRDVSSFDGKGELSVYQLKKDNSGYDTIVEKDYQVGQSQSSDFGLTDGTELDLTVLDWKTPTSQTATTAMNIAGIQANDYTSIIGTWKNAKGDTLVFDANGLTSDTLMVKLDYAQLSDGVLSANLTPKPGVNGDGGSMIKFAPAGTVYPSGVDGSQDASDVTKDRIWMGQQTIFSDPNAFYYKID